MTTNHLLAIAAGLLGIVLISAGTMKLRDVPALASSIGGYRIIPEALQGVAAFAVISSELVLGVALCIGLWCQFTLLLATILFTTFFGANLRALILDQDVECDCFGMRDRASIRVSVLRSGALVFLAAILSLLSNNDHPQLGDQLLVLLIVVLIAILVTLIATLTGAVRQLLTGMNPGRN